MAFLLDIQNKYLFDAIDDLEMIKSNPLGEYKGIVFSKAIDVAFSNADDLVRLGDDFDFSKILDGKDSVYLITRCIFCLKKLTESMRLENKEQRDFQGILWSVYCQINANGRHQQTGFNLLNTMICYTVPNGGMWFAEFVRDMDFPLQILPIDEVPYGLFFLCYLHIVASYKNLNPTAIKHISAF